MVYAVKLRHPGMELYWHDGSGELFNWSENIATYDRARADELVKALCTIGYGAVLVPLPNESSERS